MHGRKKSDAPPSAEQALALKKKVDTYRQLGKLALKQRHEGSIQTAEGMELNGKLLAVNPDVATLWNGRREALLVLTAGKDTEALRPLVAAELKVTVDALMKNSKSYPAWHHRQWVVQRFSSPASAASSAATESDSPAPQPAAAPLVDLADELKQCGRFLQADERNFHCWNYRRWVADFAGVPPAAELEFATECINRNFSNYSAWQRRSALLPRVHGNTLPIPVLRAELELLRQAVFTEPDDQSPWFYRRWVIAQLCLHIQVGAPQVDAALACFLEDCSSLIELQQLEPGSKWPRMALVHAATLLRTPAAAAALAAADRSSWVPAWRACAAALSEHGFVQSAYSQLEDLDAIHAQYYRYAAAKPA